MSLSASAEAAISRQSTHAPGLLPGRPAVPRLVRAPEHRPRPGLPRRAGRFIEELPGSAAAKNQARAALKQFGDRLVQRHVIALNPFATVRSQKHQTDGKTPEISVPQARRLLASIDVATVVGLRDRAVLGTLVYTGARVGALARLRGRDLQDHGTQRALRFREKNGKDREIPRSTRPRTVAPRLPGRRGDSSFDRRAAVPVVTRQGKLTPWRH